MHEIGAKLLPTPFNSAAHRAIFLALAGSICLVLVSIAASGILLAVAILGAIWLWIRGDRKTSWWTPMVWPVLAFFLWTMIAALLSPDVRLGLGIAKKFFIFLILFMVPWLARGPGKIVWIYQAAFLVAAATALKGLAQFASDPDRDLLHRISGFMSHYMTYSGLLMLLLVMLAAYGACLSWKKHKWVIPLCLLLSAPLFLSQTRSAWLGAVAGLAVIAALAWPRASAGLVGILVFVYLIAPAKYQQRLRSGWDPNDPNTRNRIELFQTSLRLIRDHPWFGVGPKSVSTEALRYRGSHEFPDWMYQHMHNNFLQIAAERGIPGLVLWLWFMGQLAWDASRVLGGSREGRAASNGEAAEARMAAVAALGAWFALLVSGLFEYNFGDAEVLTLFLFIMSAPYAFLKRDAPHAA